MVKKYVVSLSAEEKVLLESMLKSGTERLQTYPCAHSFAGQ